MDMIEGVKYLYEPPECMSNIDLMQMGEIERRAEEEGLGVDVLLMTCAAEGRISLYIGEHPPHGVFFLSRVPTSIAVFVEYAFASPYFSTRGVLNNIPLRHRPPHAYHKRNISCAWGIRGRAL